MLFFFYFLPVCLVAEISHDFFDTQKALIIHIYFSESLSRWKKDTNLLCFILYLEDMENCATPAYFPWAHLLNLPPSAMNPLWVLWEKYAYPCLGAPQHYQVMNWGVSVNIGTNLREHCATFCRYKYINIFSQECTSLSQGFAQIYVYF